MSLSPGHRLGPYEILGPLGAGGMGEVYLARDTRLAREVAIKVLPADVAQDRERVRRFEKEARAASSLNHPSIVTIYEIGREGETSYIAMELVEGATLRDLIASGPLPVRRLLGLGAAVADGLAKAHSSGIVHRDLKPENIMVTRDGFAKILDFGLAKLTQPEAAGGSQTEAPTISAGTEPGIVVGTVLYMSPEQAAGRHLDFASDQFSLGSVLYEMATGKRAFDGNTKPQILAAIIQDEPEPMEALNPRVPPPLRWIVERCLAKEPRDRYASTEDLARDLAGLRDRLSEAASSGATPAVSVPRARWLLPAIIVLGLVAVAGAGFLASRRIGNRRVPTFRQLTFRHGGIQLARFAPDGTVVYGAEWDGKPGDVFVVHPGNAEARSLGLSPAGLFSISSAGEMALRLGPGFAGTLARAPLAGGTPRDLLEGVIAADWAPDGKTLAVLRQDGSKRRLELPIGRVLKEGRFLWIPRVSPRGDRVACLDSGRLSIVDLSGRTTDLGVDLPTGGLAWSSPEEIWYTALESGNSSVYALIPGGRRRRVAAIPGMFILQDVDRMGRILLERDLAIYDITGMTEGESREVSLSWLDQSRVADVSADGKTLLFNETGSGSAGKPSVYVRGMNGSPAVRLGEGIAVALAPDGKWALAIQSERPVLLPTGAGEARSWNSGAIRFRNAGAFFPDGKRVLLAGEEPGHGVRLYVQEVAGKEPRPITPEGVAYTVSDPYVASGINPISPDGTFVASRNTAGEWFLFPAGKDGGSPRPISAIGPSDVLLRWTSDGKSVFVRRDGATAVVSRVDLFSGTRTPWKEFVPPSPGWGSIFGIVMTSDGRSYAYSHVRFFSDLFLLEGVE